VTLPSGEPVSERVRITLSTLNDPGIGTYTDNNGMYTFSNLRTGNYNIEVVGNVQLYLPTTESVYLPRGARLTVNIALREKSATTTTKPASNVVSATEADEKIPDAAKKEYETGIRLVKDGQIAEAVESFKRALTIFPTYLKALNDLGAQYLKLRKLDEAVKQFEAAIEINPKAFNPRLNLGIVYFEKKHYSDALEHLNQAVSLDSSSASAHLYLGMVLEETDELPNAERELSTALSIGDQPYAVAHFYLAQVQMKKGDREQTVRELNMFLQAAPNHPLAPRARKIIEGLNQQ
jgi:tetratricopeptide (TPR) repeat protein